MAKSEDRIWPITRSREHCSSLLKSRICNTETLSSAVATEHFLLRRGHGQPARYGAPAAHHRLSVRVGRHVVLQSKSGCQILMQGWASCMQMAAKFTLCKQIKNCICIFFISWKNIYPR